MYNFKDKIEDYTKWEFIELPGEFTNPTGDNARLKGEELDKYWDDPEEHLTKIMQHPLISDLIYYPAKEGGDKPENILKIVKEWWRSQGLPLFKDPERTLNRTCHLKIIMFWLSDDFRYEKVIVAIAVIISDVKRKHR